MTIERVEEEPRLPHQSAKFALSIRTQHVVAELVASQSEADLIDIAETLGDLGQDFVWK